ncbi:hypothetical protein BRC81_15415 [Halobacteriales archaeon QS_1_68_20]|nr:MAG: hypothetical protein BRC81_15415 [Halobacteriales archaeon QS_1_68_20]
MTETTRRDSDRDAQTDRENDDRPTLKDVDHTPPAGAADASRVFARGGERPAATTDGGATRGRTSDDEDGEPAEA